MVKLVLVSFKDLVGSLVVQNCSADRQGLCHQTNDHRCNREVSSFIVSNPALNSYIPALISTLEFLQNRTQVASISHRSLSAWHIFSSATEQERMQKSCALRPVAEGDENSSWHLHVAHDQEPLYIIKHFNRLIFLVAFKTILPSVKQAFMLLLIHRNIWSLVFKALRQYGNKHL